LSPSSTAIAKARLCDHTASSNFPRALVRTASKKNRLTCSPESEEFAKADEPSLIVGRRCVGSSTRDAFAVHFFEVQQVR
jgi:hypothetical protein